MNNSPFKIEQFNQAEFKTKLEKHFTNVKLKYSKITVHDPKKEVKILPKITDNRASKYEPMHTFVYIIPNSLNTAIVIAENKFAAAILLRQELAKNGFGDCEIDEVCMHRIRNNVAKVIIL